MWPTLLTEAELFPLSRQPQLEGNKLWKVAAAGGFAQTKSILIWYPDGRAPIYFALCMLLYPLPRLCRENRSKLHP